MKIQTGNKEIDNTEREIKLTITSFIPLIEALLRNAQNDRDFGPKELEFHFIPISTMLGKRVFFFPSVSPQMLSFT